MRRRAEERQNQVVGAPPLCSLRNFFDKVHRYIVALHNKRTGTISLLPSAKSPHVLQRTVKALKSDQAATSSTTAVYQQARTALGETFGTKKAKAAIRAHERNKIDVGAMEDVMDYVMQGIEKGAEGLMTTGPSCLPRWP